MSRDKEIETAQLSASAMMSDSTIKLPGKDMGEDGIPSDSISSVSAADNATSATNGAIHDQILTSEQGYNSTVPQSDDKGYFNTSGGSNTGIQPDNASLLYYRPGCRIGFSNGTNNNNLSSKASALPSNSKVQHPAAYFSRSTYQNHSHSPLNKLGSRSQYLGTIRGSHHAGKLPSFTNRGSHALTQYGQVNYQSNDRVWNNNYRYKSGDNFGTSGEIKSVTELSRGPRADNLNKSEVEQLPFAIKRDTYNLHDFQTVYDCAKFYVIKSYSEDDIHKCIKYNVWSSTPSGNKKLDAAFREADAKTSETGRICPVLLFFSVNASGQFVGVAEMIGHVDFTKSMEFWQLDKWNGFFPVKWHIIKDVPNTLLRHIILDDCENRPVTYTRDTQEIGLKQGLEMLNNFKNYSEKTSVLDDYSFYEKREKMLKANRNHGRPANSQANGFQNGDYEEDNLERYGEGRIREQSAMAGTQSLTPQSMPYRPVQRRIPSTGLPSAYSTAPTKPDIWSGCSFCAVWRAHPRPSFCCGRNQTACRRSIPWSPVSSWPHHSRRSVDESRKDSAAKSGVLLRRDILGRR